MLAADLTELFVRLDWAGMLWGGLWAALVAFTFGLSFLLWTRWGNYHLTGKCVLFSLLAHLILGLFFATAEVVEDVVVALNTPAEDSAITIERVRMINASNDANESTTDGRSDDAVNPGVWDRGGGNAPIDSPTLSRDGPESTPVQEPQRYTSGERTPLPQETPRPNVPLAITKPNDPELSRPMPESSERAELTAAPESPVATAGEGSREVVPESMNTRNVPALGSSSVNRVRVPREESDNFEPGSEAGRFTPQIPVGGNATVPDAPARSVPSALRVGAPGPAADSRVSAGPIAKPEASGAGGSAPGGGSGTGSQPSSSVRLGSPTGRANGEGAGTLPTRAGSGGKESAVVPQASIPGSGPVGVGSGGSIFGNPDAVASRSGGAGSAGPATDRPGIRLGTPEIYRERTNPNKSEQAVKRGGSKASEEAVDRALQWLATHQSPDGHWDIDGFSAQCPQGSVCSGPGTQNRDDCAVTGLVLLAFLGAGNTHWEGKYASNVLGGLNWLIQQEKEDGDLRGTGRMYSHGIATLALSEALGMSSDQKLRDPVERAVRFIIAAQNPTTGGWRYIPGQYGDTSVFGWQLMALKSASLAGIEVPDPTWQKARGWLNLVASGRHNGLAKYQPTEAASPPMTAEALVCRVFLGDSTESPTLREAADYLMQFKPQWGRLNLYYWYYGTLASFQMGGDYWTQWNSSVRDTLISHQVRQGHATGSWDPNPTLDPWGREGGRVFSTALAALCLEVYYRFLPVQSLTGDESPARGNSSTTRDAQSKN